VPPRLPYQLPLPGQQVGALALGVVNVVGVVLLSTMLADPIAKLSLYRQGLGFILGLLPALQAYAGAFFAIPLVRAFVDARRNAAIEERNDARLEVGRLGAGRETRGPCRQRGPASGLAAAPSGPACPSTPRRLSHNPLPPPPPPRPRQALELLSSPDRELDAKLAAARKLGSRKVIGRQDVVYSTERGSDEQVNRMEQEEFDQRLSGGRGFDRGGSGDAERRQLPEGRANRIDDVFGRRQQREGEAQRLRPDERDVRRRGDDWGDRW
jgi:hypothetical protein